MKKLLILFVLMLLPLVASAQVKRTINVETAGTLPTLIPDAEKYSIEELTLTGELNGSDFRLLRDMAGNNYQGQPTDGKLKVLDLSGISIVAGGDPYLQATEIKGKRRGIGFGKEMSLSLLNPNLLPEYLFYGCNLYEIMLPNTLKQIDDYVFTDCNLTSIVIPKSVSLIRRYAFQNCYDLTSIVVEEGNAVYDSRDNCNAIIESGTNTLRIGCKGSSIPTTVTSIGDAAFYSSTLSEISIPNSVTHIGYSAFYDSNLKSIVIPKSVISIKDGVFGQCHHLTSISVDFENEVFDSRENCNAIIETSKDSLIAGCSKTIIPGTVTTIGVKAFNGIPIKSLSIPSSVRKITTLAFSNCNGLTKIIIPEGVETIGDHCFSSCYSLTSVELPASLCSIGNSVFRSCNKLLTVVSKIEDPFAIEDNTFTTYGQTTLYVPQGTKSKYQSLAVWKEFSNIVEMGLEKDGIYYNKKNDQEVEVTSNPLKYSGDIVIPEKVTFDGVEYNVNAIGNYAFEECRDLKSISIPNSVCTIGDMAFQSCVGLTSLLIPKGVIAIGQFSFQGCSSLTALTIPQNVAKIERGAFASCTSLKSIVVEEGNSNYDSRNNCNAILETSTNTLIAGCINTIIPKTTLSIGNEAFQSCKLVIINVPEGVTSIGSAAFVWCNELKRVSIPSSVTYIGDWAFSDCKKLTDFYCSSEVIPTTGNEVFVNSNLENATLYVPTASISAYATADSWKGFKNVKDFGGVSALIDFADSKVKEICVANWDLNGDGELNLLEASMVSSLGEAFKGNREVETFDELQYFTGITSIQSQAFYGCQNLKSVIIPENVSTIQDLLFYSWKPQHIAVVKNNPYFIDADGVLYNKDMTTLVYYTNMNDRTTFDIPSSVTYIRSFAFAGNKLTSLVIPEGVKTIGSEVFSSQTLTSITFPKSVTSIGTYLFEYCRSLTSIKVEAGNPVYDSRDNCNAIIMTNKNALVQGCSATVIPESVTSIGDNAFWCIHSDFSLIIPDNVVSIGRMAFAGSNLTSVTLPGSIKSIGNAAFSCFSLTSVTVMNQEPLTISEETFSDRDKVTLYVPDGTKAAYQAADYWKEFKNIFEIGAVTSIPIGKSGKASYCGDKSLDFSFSDEIKAYIATGFDETDGTIWLTRVKDVPAGTPVLIKGVAEKTYQVPVTDSQNSYYKNMFKGNISGETIQINETEGGLVNYYLSGDGIFKKVKNYANIGNNKSYLQLPGTFNSATAGETQKVTLGASGKASYAAPVDLDFTNVEGLKAFTATGYDKSSKTIWLTRVMKVQKGEGVLLKGDAKDYQIPSVAVQSSYMNMFVGNTSGAQIQVQETSDDGTLTNYYLKADGTFVSVKGYAKIGNNKCYLALPTEMVATAASTRGEANYFLDEPEVIKMPILFRSLDTEGDGTTGVREVKSGEVKSEEWFTLQGQRVDNPGKGIYIKNGKKVVVK